MMRCRRLGKLLTIGALLSVPVTGCGSNSSNNSEDASVSEDTDTDNGGDGDGGTTGDAGSDRSTSDIHPACETPIATVPIDEPNPADCLTDASAGDHTFKCGDVSFLLKVPERCTQYSCGLIVDVHGGTMNGKQMRQVTELDRLAPPCDYIVLHPSETSPLVPGLSQTSQWHDDDDPKIKTFIERVFNVFQIDRDRVHFTGFSLGGNMSWRFICNYGDLFTSVAPIAATDTCADNGLTPELPILYMHGRKDLVVSYSSGTKMIARVTEGLDMEAPSVIEETDGYKRVRYENPRGVVLDFIDHTYGGQAVLDGHCVPGGIDRTGPFATTCSTPKNIEHLHWGKVALDWFLAMEGR